MLKHSEPLKGKKDKYVNGYGPESESEEEDKSVKSSNEDLFQDLINMVKNIEKDLENIDSKIEKIHNELDNEETTIENMEGSGDYVAWQSIKDFLQTKLEYYKSRSQHYKSMIETLEDLQKKSEKDLKEAKKEHNELTNQGFLATETESDDESDEEKIKELSDKIKDLQEGLDKLKIELPLLKHKVEKVYHQLEIDIKEMIQTYHKTPSSTLTEPNRIAVAQRDDLHKLLSLAGHHYTNETIAEISDEGKKARRTLSQIIIESSGVKKLKETDFLKNEDAYRNETLLTKKNRGKMR
jgi:DNA repair exonuclease SbcCD ATPase subunit